MPTTIIRCAIVAAIALTTAAGAANGGTVAACSDWRATLAADNAARTQETQTALVAAERAVLRTVENKDAAATIDQLRAAANAARDAKDSAVMWAALLPANEEVSQLVRDALSAIEGANHAALMVICGR